MLPGLLTRHRFLVANTRTALFFLGIHLSGWCVQGRLWDMLTYPIGGPLSIFGLEGALGLVAYEGKSVAGSTLTYALNNLLNAPWPNVEGKEMRSFWTAAVLVVSLCVCGCAPTPYQRACMAFRHGFADTEFSDDTFHVAFTANYATPGSTLLEYLFRRAADVTLQHKFRYFAVVREPRPLANYKVIYRYQADQGAGIDAEEVEVPAKGTLHMTIQCFQYDWQAADMQPIDAIAHLPMSRRSRPW